MTARLDLQELSRLMSKPNVDALRTALETADAVDSDLVKDIASLTAGTNQTLYIDGNGDAALTGLSAFIRALLDDENASEARSTLGIDESAVTQAQVAARVSLRL